MQQLPLTLTARRGRDGLAPFRDAVGLPEMRPLEGKVRQLASPFRLSDTPPTFRRFAPVLGEHSVEVLQSIGYSENEIGALEKAGVVRAQNFRP